MGYPRVIIVGAGFGGLNVATGLRDHLFEITLIDKTNHHLFQPLLYQVASAALAPRDIAIPIREIVKDQKNCTVVMENVVDIYKKNQEVKLSNGQRWEYDYLVIATGARHSYFGNDEWEKNAPGLKTLTDAITIRQNILRAYERAEICDSYSETEKLLSFIIIGGGPTGVEMAGAAAEIAHKTMLRNFRKINPCKAQIYLIEAGPRILSAFPESLSKKAKKDLEKLGVRVLVNTVVTQVNKKSIHTGSKEIFANNIIWAAGNEASPLLQKLDIPLDRQGRAIVNPDLTIPDHPEIFVIGDAAQAKNKKGNALPGIAPVAIQQARYVAKLIRKNISAEKRKPFVYFDKGMMATIGKAKAVATIGKWRFSGFFAWCTWCFVHILYLIDFKNRMIVMLEWCFWYLTGKRGSRLIHKGINRDKKK